MDLKQLEYFVRVADSGGFSAAGSGLQLTQSALSRQIKLLESELGHRLFTRTGRGIETTQLFAQRQRRAIAGDPLDD